METQTQAQIEEVLFEALMDLDNPQARGAFLDQTCRGNPELRARLEALAAMRDEAEKFFDTRPVSEPPVFETFHEVSAAPDADFTEGIGTKIGRYRLLERLGEGGCGVVYLAEQVEPVRRRVALKIIRVGMNTANIIDRFESERQALAVMDHPNIARVLDAGATSSGRPFFVMEMVEGLRITEFCDRNRLDLTARLKLFIPVCMAIQHAHQKGIIHCDIKPSNVMVSMHDGVAVPKVIDFGIAKATEGKHPDILASASPPLIGTPTYMSPEQLDANGLDVDTRSDIYSLGALLYEMLTGKPPCDPEALRNADAETIRRVLSETPPVKPSKRLAQCPMAEQEKLATLRRVEPSRFPRVLRGDLDAIVMKAMENDRQRRYGTASELAADVSRHLTSEPVLARGRAGGGYLLGKLIRRNKVAFAGGTIAFLALTAGFGTSTRLLFREARARQEQERLRAEAEIARTSEIMLRRKAQAGERVAQATVLSNQGKLLEADELLGRVLMEDVPSSLESANTFRVAAEWLLREGRWRDASQRFSAVAQAISRVDKSDNGGISLHFVAAAAAVVDAGDFEHHEELRQMAAGRFATTTDPIVADEVVKTCLIRPATPDLLARIEPLVTAMQVNIPWDREDLPNENMEAWQMLSLSLASYRKGDFSRAESWARRCLRHPNLIDSRASAARCVLAMALHQSGHPEDARSELEAARVVVDTYFEQPINTQWDQSGYWFDWVIARILLKEAYAVPGD